MTTAGVVGVGAMGSVIVERFVAAGVRTLAYDVSRDAVQRAAGLGAEPRASIAELDANVPITTHLIAMTKRMKAPDPVARFRFSMKGSSERELVTRVL